MIYTENSALVSEGSTAAEVATMSGESTMTQGSAVSRGATSAEDRVNRLAQGAHAAVDRIAEKAIPAVQRLRGGANSAAATLRTRADDLDGMQRRWVESSRGCVRNHPLVSVGAAVAAGMILSRLMGRRD